MFRQVVAQTWAEGVTEDQRLGYVRAFMRLSRIPEVVAIQAGVDAGLFPDNYHFVAVLDFADLDAARRYVAHPDHQAFLAEWARPLAAGRVVVQHEWGDGSVVGVHHLKLPVADVVRSQDWYVAALGFAADLQFVEDGVVRGVALRHPVAGLRLALRHDPVRAAALAGFDALSLAVGTRTDLDQVVARARAAAGATPGPVVEGREGWACDLPDPDGIVTRLYTHARHPPGPDTAG